MSNYWFIVISSKSERNIIIHTRDISLDIEYNLNKDLVK